jgi:hypothetical protein
MTGWVAAGASVLAGAANAGTQNSTGLSPNVSAYWTDVLLRPGAVQTHASIAWRRYAQADTTATDASTSTDDESIRNDQGFSARPMTAVPSGNNNVENDLSKGSHDQDTAPATRAAEPPTEPHVITIPVEGDSGNAGEDNSAAVQPVRPDTGGDRAELGRIIEIGVTESGSLSTSDRDRAIQIVAQDTGLPAAEAVRRIDNAQAQIKADGARAAETARKIARNASLWIAFALLFGAMVAAMAAISARWEDDRITFGWRPRRSEPV